MRTAGMAQLPGTAAECGAAVVGLGCMCKHTAGGWIPIGHTA
jgi:hypothetical protein